MGGRTGPRRSEQPSSTLSWTLRPKRSRIANAFAGLRHHHPKRSASLSSVIGNFWSLGVSYVRQPLHGSALDRPSLGACIGANCGALVSDNFARDKV